MTLSKARRYVSTDWAYRMCGNFEKKKKVNWRKWKKKKHIDIDRVQIFLLIKKNGSLINAANKNIIDEATKWIQRWKWS